MFGAIVEQTPKGPMPPRPINDPTKARCAVLTMVKDDHFFLRRWLAHYGALVGRQHLYVLSHGNDPAIREIAAGANVINIPYDPSRYHFDRRRWQMLGEMTSGLLRYYNWVICGDVDEFVVVDPDVAPNLLDYIEAKSARATPAVICPLGLEIIHNPDLEPEPLNEAAPILSRRRLFRVNANYSKPCITRSPIQFTPGGHSCNIDNRALDPHLYLLHLRFVSHDLTLARLKGRAEMKAQEAGNGTEPPRRAIWESDAEGYLELSQKTPVAETVDFTDFRRIMIEKKRTIPEKNLWFWGGGRTKDLYRLPDRFAAVL